MKDNHKLNNLQKKAITKIDEIFDKNVYDLEVDTKAFYLEKENFELKLTYKCNSMIIRFYLYYDQLEYSIYKQKKELSHCLIEDFFSEEEMLVRFFKYLLDDIKKY
jgi:hypothetical protein